MGRGGNVITAAAHSLCHKLEARMLIQGAEEPSANTGVLKSGPGLPSLSLGKRTFWN